MYTWSGLIRLICSISLLVLLLAASLYSGCSSVPFRERADTLFHITDNVTYYYDLEAPVEKFFLPYVLAEVSGLTYLEEDRVLCVEDELGKVYEYDLKSKEIVNAITFSKPGDFEGIEVVEDTVYVLKSNGDLYAFAYTKENATGATRYESKLSQENDTEGLGFNPYSGSLLIACKAEEKIKGVNAIGKTIHGFDRKKKKLNDDPVFWITAKKMKDFFEANRDYEYEEDRIKFEPSAIANNPLDGYFYLLASVGKLLIVLDKNGNIKATYPIAPDILGQPEGITFSPNGNLYISSEGGDARGYIMKFTAKEK